MVYIILNMEVIIMTIDKAPIGDRRTGWGQLSTEPSLLGRLGGVAAETARIERREKSRRFADQRRDTANDQSNGVGSPRMRAPA